MVARAGSHPNGTRSCHELVMVIVGVVRVLLLLLALITCLLLAVLEMELLHSLLMVVLVGPRAGVWVSSGQVVVACARSPGAVQGGGQLVQVVIGREVAGRGEFG